MEINRVIVGPLETNSYILTIKDAALLIDPGDECEKILEKLGGKDIIGILITHHHFDHVGALEAIVQAKNAKVYDHENLSEGKNEIGPFEFEITKTPGHKDDSISIYFEKENVLFSGDFIFKGTIGRWDLPGGSITDMKKSINKILEYPLETKIYPGHGEATTLGAEKDNLEKYAKYF